ncbi:MAG: hypothetical protein JSS27_03055 [Planctomycetes bacterium]|nr:hypothetical protein [Planctomycetota bacterium]
MSGRPISERCPSAEEFNGYYNIRDEESPSQQYPILRSTTALPVWDELEFWDVYFAAEDWSRENSPAAPKPEIDHLASPGMWVRDWSSPRTLLVDIGDHSWLTPSLLKRLQADVVKKFPLWRFSLIGEASSNVIMVYPDAIRIGNRPADADWEEALREVAASEAILREERLHPQRAHYAFLERRLPSVVNEMGDRAFVLFDLIDVGIIDYSSLTLCFLVQGAEPDADSYFTVRSPGEMAESEFSTCRGPAVSADGKMLWNFPLDQTPAFYLNRWFLPREFRGLVTIQADATGDEFEYEVKTENIVHCEWPVVPDAL